MRCIQTNYDSDTSRPDVLLCSRGHTDRRTTIQRRITERIIVGIYEVTFRLQRLANFVAIGVVPAAKASHARSAYTVGCVYYSNGNYHALGKWVPSIVGASYGAGDLVTARLDLPANTIAFRKNGADVGTPQKIAPGDAYHFAFEAWCEDDAVTIVEEELQ